VIAISIEENVYIKDFQWDVVKVSARLRALQTEGKERCCHENCFQEKKPNLLTDNPHQIVLFPSKFSNSLLTAFKKVEPNAPSIMR
jgi:hypothetical protein